MTDFIKQKTNKLYDEDELDLIFESAVDIATFHDREDYPGLVKYCKQRVEQFPDDPCSQYHLGEAYVLNGEYEKAIDLLTSHHRKQAGNLNFQYVILDALFATGKDENDFDWAEKPIILRMTKNVLDYCYEFLKNKRKPRFINDLYMEFIVEGYLLFSEEELLKGLLEDKRFLVSEQDEGVFAKVQVVRSRR